MRTWLPTVLATLFLASCMCTEELNSSVDLTVRAADDGPLEGLDVRYSVDGGSWKDCEEEDEDTGGPATEVEAVCGWEERGDFEIEVAATGYQTHTESVKVRGDYCHVDGEWLEVVLQPS